jgi:hypothetical protein
MSTLLVNVTRFFKVPFSQKVFRRQLYVGTGLLSWAPPALPFCASMKSHWPFLGWLGNQVLGSRRCVCGDVLLEIARYVCERFWDRTLRRKWGLTPFGLCLCVPQTKRLSPKVSIRFLAKPVNMEMLFLDTLPQCSLCLAFLSWCFLSLSRYVMAGCFSIIPCSLEQGILLFLSRVATTGFRQPFYEDLKRNHCPYHVVDVCWHYT